MDSDKAFLVRGTPIYPVDSLQEGKLYRFRNMPGVDASTLFANPKTVSAVLEGEEIPIAEVDCSEEESSEC